MRAAVYDRSGPARDVLRVVDLDRPEPAQGRCASGSVSRRSSHRPQGPRRGTGQDHALPLGDPPPGRGRRDRRGVCSDGPVAGQTILVAGGAGAVAHFTIELVRHAGATVIATVSSPEKAALAEAAGAGLVVDYRDRDAAGRRPQGGPWYWHGRPNPCARPGASMRLYPLVPAPAATPRSGRTPRRCPMPNGPSCSRSCSAPPRRRAAGHPSTRCAVHHHCHPTGYAAGFHGCCAHSARRRARRNPPVALPAGPRAGPPGLPPATRRSRSPLRSPRRRRPSLRRPPDRLGRPFTRRPRSTASPACPG